ncbi:hypothetical protein BB561_005781 [Smittium simulii]|uniref:UBC core domain-containing protein n=1 Tax=Smittium simulii TaxID=133385 RepID=A0A2T9Y8C1_9FUNG|nr:hypothetical protein BB561_005781 [Smittium simulii]
MSGICKSRLMEERKQWRKDHPFGFFAKPKKEADGTLNLLEWEVNRPFGIVTRKQKEYGRLIIDMCNSILNEEKGWKPSITLKQILLGIQDLLNDPNNGDPAQSDAYYMYKNDKTAYEKKVRQQAREHMPTD